MTSTAKSEANRKNAQRSTGPKTPAGKAIAAQNARSHGLTAETNVLDTEDPAAFAAWTESVEADLVPVGSLEDALVDRISGLAWRLRRVGSVEASLFRHQVFQAQARRYREQAAALEVKNGLDHWDKEMLQRLGATVTDPDQHRQLLAQAAEADARRDSETLATTLVNDAANANALTKLSRYETALERGLYRALHELQRLQAARAGLAVSAPAVLDVNVSTPTE